MEETISLQELVGVLKKRIGLIIVSMILGLGIAGVLTFFVITPKYSSQAQLLVRLTQNEASNVNDINANLQMINTYKDLIRSDTVMNEVQNRMKTDYDTDLSVSTLRDSIEVTQSQNSQMFSIISKEEDPVIAQNIANQTALVFQERAKEIVNIDKTSIISTATANFSPVSPNDKLNLVIGLVLGLMVGIALVFILELFDKTIKDDRFVAEELGFTVLGIVPNMTAKELNAKLIRTNPIASLNSENGERMKTDSPNNTDTSKPVRRVRPKI